MFGELKEVKYFKEIADFKSLLMLNILKKLNVWRVSKKQRRMDFFCE